VLIEPLEDNIGARAYRRLITLGAGRRTTLTPSESVTQDLGSLVNEARERFGVRPKNPSRGWELRADIRWALDELQSRFGGKS
jgi:hypothetical protein